MYVLNKIKSAMGVLVNDTAPKAAGKKLSKNSGSRKCLIEKAEWVKLIPYIKQRLNEDGVTYAFLGRELGERYGGEGETLSRARIEQVVKWLNSNYEAGIRLKKASGRGIPKSAVRS